MRLWASRGLLEAAQVGGLLLAHGMHALGRPGGAGGAVGRPGQLEQVALQRYERTSAGDTPPALPCIARCVGTALPHALCHAMLCCAALQIHTSKMTTNSFIGRDVDLYELAQLTKNFRCGPGGGGGGVGAVSCMRAQILAVGGGGAWA